MMRPMAGGLRVSDLLNVSHPPSPEYAYRQETLIVPPEAPAENQIEFDTGLIVAMPDTFDPDVSWTERSIPRSEIKEQPVTHLVRLSQGKLLKNILTKTVYNSAGLSSDCDRIYLHSEKDVCVYDIADAEDDASSINHQQIYNHRFANSERIMYVALSATFLVVATIKQTYIIEFSVRAIVKALPNNGYNPCALAVHETGVHLIVILGQCRERTSVAYQGQVLIYKYLIGRGMDTPTTLVLPEADCPKLLYIEANGTIICCVTRIHNKVIVWKTEDEFTTVGQSLAFVKNSYAPVRLHLITCAKPSMVDRC